MKSVSNIICNIQKTKNILKCNIYIFYSYKSIYLPTPSASSRMRLKINF